MKQIQIFKKIFNKNNRTTLKEFLGRRVIFFINLGLITGLSLFVVDFLFAFGLQLFLFELGITSENLIHPLLKSFNLSTIAVILSLICLVFLRSFLQWIQAFSDRSAGAIFRHLYRIKIMRWIFRSKTTNSAEATYLLNDATTSTTGGIGALQSFLSQLTTSVFLMASLLYLSPALTVSTLVLFVLLYPGYKQFNKWVNVASNKLKTRWKITNERALQGIKNIILLRIYGMTPTEEAYAERNLRSNLELNLKFFKGSSAIAILPQMVGFVFVSIIVYVSKTSIKLSPDLLLAYFYLALRMIQSLGSMSKSYTRVNFEIPLMLDVIRWWQQNKQIVEAPLTHDQHYDLKNALDEPFGWDINHLSFKYEDSNDYIFKDFSLKISPKETVVLIGESGAGKTTLVNLLIGELKPEDPSTIEIIMNNGHKISLFSERSKIYPCIGYLGPESFMVEGSIKDNLLYGLHHSITEDKIRESLKLAQCDFVQELPKGLDHFLSEQGHGLSAGQKQRLGLARALLRDPKVLLLDEATSNLDTATENKIINTLHSLKKSMTIIIVTHRKSLIQLADKTITLQ